MNQVDDTPAPEHFRFGDNWASYSRIVSGHKLKGASDGLLKLVDGQDLAGARFLDIGCGSGVHAVAAVHAGAEHVTAIDRDATSVATTQAMLSRHAPNGRWSVEQTSVFDVTPRTHGLFDIVYSWGVLHHTGDLERALASAAAMVRPGGQLAIALYRPVKLDPFWVWEKRWYKDAGPRQQRFVQGIYLTLFRAGLIATGRSYRRHEQSYTVRGMDMRHDIHDWLGGYPYESMGPQQVRHALGTLGFKECRAFVKPGGVGLFGSGCDEYVFRRTQGAHAAT